MRIGLQTWGSDGDILPFVALAGGLSAARHDVSLVITSVDGKDYRSFSDMLNFNIKQTGVLFEDKTEFALLARKVGFEKNPLKQMDLVLKEMFEPFADEMFSEAEKLSEENDVIIGHFVHYPVQVAAEKARRPYITVTLNHMGIPTRFTPPSRMPNLGRVINPLQWKFIMNVMSKRFAPAINRFRASKGCPPIRSVREVWESRVLNLIAVGQVFCKGYSDWEDYQRVCGFLDMPAWDDAPSVSSGMEGFIASGPPPIYMTFGSMVTEIHDSEYINATARLMMDAARLAGTRAIIQLCWDAVSGTEESPDIYKTNRAPHKAIFPRCSAVVHHGGAGTTHSATLAGRPSVVVEHIADQFFWGSELRRMGIAPRPLRRTTVTAGRLADRIRSVLDSPSMKTRAQHLGERLRQEDGVGRAVELIEECVKII